jgi:hypothetical protein
MVQRYKNKSKIAVISSFFFVADVAADRFAPIVLHY